MTVSVTDGDIYPHLHVFENNEFEHSVLMTPRVLMVGRRGTKRKAEEDEKPKEEKKKQVEGDQGAPRVVIEHW